MLTIVIFNVQIQTQCIGAYKNGCARMSEEPYHASVQLYVPNFNPEKKNKNKRKYMNNVSKISICKYCW